MDLRRSLRRVALALALAGAPALAAAPPAAAAATTKKPAAAPVRPATRASAGPTALDDEGEFEGDPEGEFEGAPAGDRESELAAIEAEILAEIAAGKHPAEAPFEPEPAPAPEDDHPRWVTHAVIAGETVDAIAARDAVPAKSLARWNKIDPKKPLRPGKELRVQAVRPPPPRERVDYTIAKGDTWEGIAAAHGVTERDLRLWNKPKKGKDGKAPKAVLRAGERLAIWAEPHAAGPTPPGRALAGRVRANAFSIGAPNRGRLVNGVELPELPELYTRRQPEKSYGSSHTVRTLILAIADFRREVRFDGDIVIGALSLRRGGRFRPHRSHQSGRDIDIRLPALPHVHHPGAPTAAEVDWKAAWRLFEAFVETGQVQYIFLDHGHQKRLYKAARAAGVPKERLAEVLQWPREPGANVGVVRHSPGHKDHFHVRVKCGPGEKQCDPGR